MAKRTNELIDSVPLDPHSRLTRAMDLMVRVAQRQTRLGSGETHADGCEIVSAAARPSDPSASAPAPRKRARNSGASDVAARQRKEVSEGIASAAARSDSPTAAVGEASGAPEEVSG